MENWTSQTLVSQTWILKRFGPNFEDVTLKLRFSRTRPWGKTTLTSVNEEEAGKALIVDSHYNLFRTNHLHITIITKTSRLWSLKEKRMMKKPRVPRNRRREQASLPSKILWIKRKYQELLRSQQPPWKVIQEPMTREVLPTGRPQDQDHDN